MSYKIQSQSNNFSNKKAYSEKINNKFLRKNSDNYRPMSAEEIARKGGKLTSHIHGKEFYRQIGLKSAQLRIKKIREPIYSED
ncbi:stress-induced protein, KGG, repeat-containing protein [Pigmentibacter ruber]|uniref:stress-induced protein, KGG, repeat-containing protein n=1 Tax=Pigmentibacter ruber TaxID=2683196 RepID=UPI00131E4F2F|nr:stress-induced protein, KGG, repeat-containing protein [Pigmentibacter ruber]BFD32294.1 hypothetical protein GTC16762_19120 [Pigmentibacter ruber]